MSFHDLALNRFAPHAGAPVSRAHGCRLTTRDEAVATGGIARLRIAAEADNALIEHPLKPMAKRDRLAQGHKARVSCGYLRSHWRSTLEPGDDLAVRRGRARQCAAFFDALAKLCEDPERSDEEVSEEVRQSARRFAEWAEEFITSEDPGHPAMPLLHPLLDTFSLSESGDLGDIPLKFGKARECALLITSVLKEMVAGPSVFRGQRGGGGHPGEERERRTRSSAWIERY